ncbi:MAG: DinB family protein [Chloroflexi bacterium]|nr:DinB family protein [Chloroflexota bacterium]
MAMKDPNRAYWNERHKRLRKALSEDGEGHALDIFLKHHAMVHSATMAQSKVCNFADEVWDDLNESDARIIPPGGEHSIAWIMWHIARIEDITMNILVAGQRQVMEQGGWLKEMSIDVGHSGNSMSNAQVTALSEGINMEGLRAYRVAVGRQTRKIASALGSDDFNKKIEPSRIQQIWDVEAVVPEAEEIVSYWSKRSIAGLLLMPATRHNLLHINEALRVKKKVC